MIRRRIALTLLLLAPVAAVGQQQDTLSFLKSVYEPYKDKGFKGQPYWEAKRFFAPDLASAIERDFAEAKKRNEVPKLDGDPFIDAQDWQIMLLSYGPTVLVGNTAAAGVGFVNLGKPKVLSLALVMTPNGWRVHDIVAPSGSLRVLYKLK